MSPYPRVGPSLTDQWALTASVSARGSVHVAPYLKDLSAETGPFLRYEANLHQCTPIAGKAQKLDACTRECPLTSICTHLSMVSDVHMYTAAPIKALSFSH